jgi:alpha,alpha-trehalase
MRGPNPAGGLAAQYDPSRDLGPLFHDVQMTRVFDDSKTFVDATPRMAPVDIAARYVARRDDEGFDLGTFVAHNFSVPVSQSPNVAARPSSSMTTHIALLWQTLVRPPDRRVAWSSLIPLPSRYVVPGGRFREIYYWDSYFTMIGLVESGRLDLVKDMLDNFAYLVEVTGHVPNANRTYYLSRSQPPFLGAMVALFADRAGTAKALPYLDALEKEYAYWMDGASGLAPSQAFRRVVRVADGSLLNRYWDDRPEPRPEAYREDVATGMRVTPADRPALYRNIRATAETGWDFSSRWLRDPRDLTTLETTDLVPVDLNSLLFETELTIARLRSARQQHGDREAAQRLSDAADRRRQALSAASYDAAEGFFFDVRWRTGTRVLDRPTMAAAVPLFFGLASMEQGRAVAARLERDFLQPGGFVTTTIASGQQWDAPNGWAPLEWMGVEGVRRYSRDDLATEAGARWLALNERTYQATGKMMEKYDVRDLQRPAGGGEYPAQDGFGWTNGVALALEAAKRRQSHRPASHQVRAELPAFVQPFRRFVRTAPRSAGGTAASRPRCRLHRARTPSRRRGDAGCGARALRACARASPRRTAPRPRS